MSPAPAGTPRAPRVTNALVLAGGRGTRLGTHDPKPITPVAGKPMLHWVLQMLERAGIEHTTIATGHAHELVEPVIEQLATNHLSTPHPVVVRRTDPELNTAARVRSALEAMPAVPDRPVLLAWCDSLTRLDLPAMLETHTRAQALVTLLGVHPPSRFGHVRMRGDRVERFEEKPAATSEWINAGLFIVEPGALAWIPDRPDASWERDVLPALAQRGTLAAHRSEHPWRCLDHEHERHALEHALRDGLLGREPID